MSDNVCALDDCFELVPADRAARRAKYHNEACRKRNARRRYSRGESNTRSGEERTLDERIEAEREKLRANELRRTLTQLGRGAAKRKEYVEAIKEVLTPFEPSEVFPIKTSETETTVEWAVCLSDWHIGQKTSIEDTGGIYEQTLEVSRLQVDKLITALTRIFYESKGKTVKKLWVLILGDIVEGDAMRPAQLREIEMPVVKQTVEALDLITYFLSTMLQFPGIEELVVDVIGGNHDRTSSRPGNAGLGENDFVDTYAWLVGAMLQRAFEDDPRVKVTNWETFFGTRTFGGLRHAFEHGASMRLGGSSYGGVPFYPIVNAARQYESMLGGVDMVWLGHLHTPYILPLGQRGHIVGNGSFPATSRFIQSRYKSLRRSQQWLAEFHRTVGVTAFRALYVDIGLPTPGEVWEKKDQGV